MLMHAVVDVCSSRSGAVVRRPNRQRDGRSRTDSSSAVFCRLPRQIQGTTVSLKDIIAHFTLVIMTLTRCHDTCANATIPLKKNNSIKS